MNTQWQHVIQASLHDAVHGALIAAFGSAHLDVAQAVSGGASGALAFRIERGERAYLLRVEGPRTPLRNPHQYTCMRMAAEAGLAPRLHYVDDRAGIAIMDFIAKQPLERYPGGALELARALGAMARDLQAASAFPVLADYRTVVARMLSYAQTFFVPGKLDAHREAVERILQIYPWDASSHVSAHNDPNPNNILFDGVRLWLIDWETAYRNDPFTDLAILCDNQARGPEWQDAFLSAWRGTSPDDDTHARLRLMTALTRVYYASLLISSVPRPEQAWDDLNALTADEFRSSVMRGVLKAGSAEMRRALALMYFGGFMTLAKQMSEDGAL